MEREILALSAVVDQPARPLVAILGGTDVGDEIQLVRRFVDLADAVCIGGAMCLPFLCVVHGVGCSLWPPEDLEPARLALAAAAQSGRLELPAFAGGTRTIAEAVASTSATTVVAGGETVQAMRVYGLQDHVSHLSTGGRATLKLLEGRELPGLQALRRATSRESGVDPRVARP